MMSFYCMILIEMDPEVANSQHNTYTMLYDFILCILLTKSVAYCFHHLDYVWTHNCVFVTTISEHHFPFDLFFLFLCRACQFPNRRLFCSRWKIKLTTNIPILFLFHFVSNCHISMFDKMLNVKKVWGRETEKERERKREQDSWVDRYTPVWCVWVCIWDVWVFGCV